MSPNSADFQFCLSFVLRFEGGYAENPSDPGGATHMGITRETLSAWRGEEVTKNEVKDLSAEEAGEIYRVKYWDPCRCENLTAPLALVVFDTAVNSGIHRAVMFLQSALEVPADGIPGPNTIVAAGACDMEAVVSHIVNLRLAFLEELPTWDVFGAGWTARCEALEKCARNLIGGT